MKMRIIIYIDSETGEIFFYTPEEDGKDAFFIEPHIKKKEGESEEENERTH